MSEGKYIVLDFPQVFMQEGELKWAFRAIIELHFYSTQSQSFLWPQLKKSPFCCKTPAILCSFLQGCDINPCCLPRFTTPH